MPKYKPPPLPEVEDWASGHERARSRSPSPFLRRSNAGKISDLATLFMLEFVRQFCAKKLLTLNHAFS